MKEKGNVNYFWNRLPESIILEILSRLPLKSLMTTRCVHKDLNLIISNNSYLKSLHLTHTSQFHNPDIIFSTTDKVFFTKKNFYIIENIGSEDQNESVLSLPEYLNNLEIVTSCNGLLCFKDHNYMDLITVCVCNPFTKESVRLPRVSSISYESYDWEYGFGFGFDPSTNEYKVLRMVLKVCLADCKQVLEAEVCTLGSTSWRRMGEVPFGPFGANKCVYFDGGIYCIGKSSEEIGIACFNVKDECFAFDPLLPEMGPVWNENIDIGVLGGELSIINYNFDLDFGEVWTRSGKEAEVCWTRFSMIQIDDIVSISLVCLLTSKKMLLLLNNNELVSCHAVVPSNEDARGIALYGMSEEILYGMSEEIRPFAHFGSLISPIMGGAAE